MFLGANTLECESSRERIGQGPIGRFAPGSELARERKGCESFLPTTFKSRTPVCHILYHEDAHDPLPNRLVHCEAK